MSTPKRAAANVIKKFRCPKCGAQPEAKCSAVSHRGDKVYVRPHLERIMAWENAPRREQ